MQTDESKTITAAELRKLKHDVKNQLSNMILCVEQLKYEITDPAPDLKYYMNAINEGCITINRLISEV